MTYKLTPEQITILSKNNVKYFPTELEQHNVRLDLAQSVCEAILKRDPKFKEEYPKLYKIVYPRIQYLYNLLQYQKTKPPIGGQCYVSQWHPETGEKRTFGNHAPIKLYYFFGSVRHLARLYKGEPSTWNRNINIFVALGLLRRVDTFRINNKAGRRSIKLKEQMELRAGFRRRALRNATVARKQLRPINFYAFYLWDEVHLAHCEAIATKLLDNGFTASGFSKIFLINAMGEKYANTVFPDERQKTLFSNYVASQIQQFISRDIERHGYTTKERVITLTPLDMGQVKANEYGFHKSNPKAILEREFHRSTAEFFKFNGIVRRKANKELKERFNLDTYKTIIYQE